MNEVISSIAKSQLTQLNSTNKTENQPTASISELNEDQTTSSITGQPKYDTLELSDEYLEYRTQSESAALEEDSSLVNSNAGTSKERPANQSPEKSRDTKEGTATSSDIVSEETSKFTESEDDETTSETYNLSLYSESELKDMLSDVKITRSEYNKEIASRRAEDSPEQAESKQGNDSIVTEE